MSRTKPPYPAKFRQQIVEMARIGRTPAELAREFAVSAQSIKNWIAQAAIDVSQPAPGKDSLNSAERAELTRLCRENRRLPQERDILTNATAWFAKSGKTFTPSSSS